MLCLHSIEAELTDEEKGIVRRDEQSRVQFPKMLMLVNIGGDGLRGLGYLYLTGQNERLFYIMELILNREKGDECGNN